MTYEKEIANIKRRDFLKFIGKAGLSLPVLQASSLGAGMLLGRQAMAADLAMRRVIFLFVPGGTPLAAAHSFTPTDSLQLNTCSVPLESVKQQCLFFKGVDIVGGGGHGNSQRVLGAFADGVSGTVDLALAEVVGATSPFSSLRLGVRSREESAVSARGFTRVTDLMDNPITAFEKLFGGGIDSSPIGAKRDTKVQQLNLQALQKIKNKLGNYELQRLEQHEAAINKLKTDVENAAANSVPAGCSDPSFNPENLSTEQVDSQFSDLFHLQTENAIMALKCNLTRIVTIQLGNNGSEFGATGLEGAYHGAIHSGVIERYEAFRIYFSALSAHLISRLAETDDPAGGKMIDSTLVVHVSDMADGNAHTGDDAPYFFAGGGSAIDKGKVMTASNHHRILDTAAEYMGAGDMPNYDTDGALSGVLL